MLSTSAIQARDLSAAEKSVCSSLRFCLDIASRHTASEFDYNVLEIEFRRFGASGRTALFSLLESDDGHADIAWLISNMAPLSPVERQRVTKKWSEGRAQTYLPLLLDGHPMSRDLLLQSLGHPNANTREQVRTALALLPRSARRFPFSKNVRASLLSALLKDPIGDAAPYLEQLNSAGYERDFTALLRSGENDIVAAAYSAVYRNSPSKAFNALLAEMARIETQVEARAIGNMLASRHKARPDGFYLKFARDMSGNPDLSVFARASGLHAVIKIAEGPFPELTPPRRDAFLSLLKGQGFVAQDQYLPYLQKVKAQAALNEIWGIAHSEKWVNRDRIADFYKAHPSFFSVVSDLIQADDIHTVSAGLRSASAKHKTIIREQIDHPVKAIALATRKHLKLNGPRVSGTMCPIDLFDLEDMRAQMPFFESGWTVADNNARVSLTREQLTSAHPTGGGWLAAYDLSAAKSVHSGGSLLHYENKSGEFRTIGDFSAPLAILPGQVLKLGQTTQNYWIIDVWGAGASDISAYTLDISTEVPRIKHIGPLPKTANGFGVSSNGDLLVVSYDKNQPPIRVSKAGAMSLYCSKQSRLAGATGAP